MVFGFWYGIHSEVFSFFGAGGGGGRPVVILSREKGRTPLLKGLFLGLLWAKKGLLLVVRKMALPAITELFRECAIEYRSSKTVDITG